MFRYKIILIAIGFGLVSMLSFAQTVNLSFRPVAAEYSQQLDRIIMVSAAPNLLHIYNGANQSDVTVNLQKAPLTVSLSPDGARAAVGHQNLISYVNLETGVVERTYTIAVSAQNLALSPTWIYVMPTYLGGSVSVNIANGAVVNNNSVGYGSGGRFNVAVNAIYGTMDGLSPNDIVRYEISTGPITRSTDSVYHGDYKVCGPVFFSLDGSRIYTGCGTVFRASVDPALDMRYVTTLVGASYVSALAESAVRKRVALIQRAAYAGSLDLINDSVIFLYEGDHLNPAGQFALADFRAGSRTFKAHGKWVFFNAASTFLYAIVQADSNSGILDDFALQSFPLAPPTSCGANFSPGTADVIAEGTIGMASVLGNPTCTYQAESSVPWLQVISGGYGSGNGTLSYIARVNNGGPRSGTISIGSATLTITQAAAAPATTMTRLPYNIVNAAFDKPLDRLILTSAVPNELHIFDAMGGGEQTVALASPPLGLSVSPDGKFAAVGHDGWVSYVDLEAPAVLREFQVITDVRNILLAGNGYMYLFPDRDWSDIYSLNMSTGVLTATAAIYDGRVPRLTSDGAFMYLGGNWLSKWSLTDGVAKRLSRGTSDSTCGNLWLTEDDRRMFTACGRVLRTSSVAAEDLQPNGSLAPLNVLAWMDHSAIRRATIVIPTNDRYSERPPALRLQMYGDAFLDFLGSIELPQFIVGGQAYDAFGQFVFWNRDGSKLISVQKADAAAKLLSSYALTVLPALITDQTPFTIVPNGGFSTTSTGTARGTTVGSARIQRGAGSSSPSGLAIFASRQNGVLVSEATVPAVSPILSGRIYAEVNGKVNTGLAVSNPSATTAKLSFYFTDENGANFGAGTTTITPHGQIAAFLDESPFNVGRTVTGTFTFTSDVPVGAIALRGLINERSEFLWTTLPVVQPNFGFGALFPSFADGGGWSTQFILINPTNSTIKGVLQFYPQGSMSPIPSTTPVSVTVNGETGDKFAYTIPPNTSRVMTTSGSGTAIQVGWVSTLRDPGFSAPTGVAIFAQHNSAGVTVSEAGIPSSTFGQSFQMYVENSSDASHIQSGLAIANPNGGLMNLRLELTSLNGDSTGSATLTVPANGQAQMFLNQIRGFENLPAPFQGILKISTDSGLFALVGLRSRYNERGEFLVTTTPPVGDSFSIQTAQEVIFPHVVDGGGYTTQFILFGSQPANGELQVFTQSGQKLVFTFK